MTTDILSAETMLPELAALATSELRAALAVAITATADGLARAAVIWSELSRRGEATPELRSGLATWLPRIARRELAAEAVIAFAGQRLLLQRMIGMPLDEQRRYAAGSTMPIAVFDAAGKVTGEERPLNTLSSRQVVIAVDSGTIRPLSAQIKMLSAMQSTPRRQHAPHTTVSITADPASGIIQIGHARIRPSDLNEALHQLGLRITKIPTARASGHSGADGKEER